MSETEDRRLQYVRVTNNLPFAFVDRYDGVPVTIPPGKSENLPPDMALHFFGYGGGEEPGQRAAMMKHTAKRHGWNTPEYVAVNPETGKSKAEDYFGKLEIKAVMFKLVPVADDADPAKPIPADAGIEGETGREAGTGRFTPSAAPRMAPKRVEVNVT